MPAPSSRRRPRPTRSSSIAFGPATSADATAKAAGTESATVLGLFALDLLGVPPARIRMVAPGAADAKAGFVLGGRARRRR